MENNKSYKLYNSYHKNKINKIIHIFGIPAIVWSVFLLSNKLKILKFRLSNIIYLIYAYKYIKIDIDLGIKSSIFYFILLKTADKYYKNNSYNKCLKLAFLINLFSWSLQILGHRIFEKNMPALTKSIADSISIAPLFTIKHLNNYLLKN